MLLILVNTVSAAIPYAETDILAYFTMDDNETTTAVTNSRLAANYGTLKGGDTTRTLSKVGRIGNALDFNGADDWVRINNSNSVLMIPTTQSFSMTGWFYSDGSGSRQYIIGNFHSSSTYMCSYYYDDLTNRAGALLKTDGVIAEPVDRVINFNSRWYFATLTYNATSETAKIYHNATLYNTTVQTSFSGGYFTTADSSTNGWLIGRLRVSSTGSYFNGKLDELAVWNKTLSQTEINELYNGGAGLTYTDLFAAGSPETTLTVTYPDSIHPPIANASFYVYGNASTYHARVYINGSEVWESYALANNTVTSVSMGDLEDGTYYNFTLWVNNSGTIETYNNVFLAQYELLAFKANNSRYNTALSSFAVNINDGETIQSTSNGTAYITNNFTTGSILVKYYQNGFNDSFYLYNVTPLDDWMATGQLTPASVTINVRGEKAPYSWLKFNLTMFNDSLTKNYSNRNATLYLHYTNATLGETTINIDRKGYIQRTYFLTISSTSALTLNAYLLDEYNGIYYSFVVTDYNNIPIADAQIKAQLTIDSTLQTVEQGKTDATGKDYFYLDPYSVYSITVEADGYVSMTFNVIPDPNNKVTYVRLYSTGSTGSELINFTSYMDAISYQVRPLSRYANSTFNIEYELSSSDNDLELQGFKLYAVINGSFVLMNNSNLTTQPSGTTQVTEAITDYGTYAIVPYFKRSDYLNETLPPVYFYLYNYTGLAGITPDLQAAIGTGGLLTVTFIIVILVMAFVARFSMVGAGVAGLAVMGYIFVLYPFNIGFITSWGIWLAIALVFAAFNIIRGRYFG